MSDVSFRILSPLPLNRDQDVRKVMQLWADKAPGFLPDRWGYSEPLRRHFSMEGLDDALRKWEFGLLLKRVAPPKLGGSISPGGERHDAHSSWSIFLSRLRDFEQAAFCNLLEASAPALSADLGLVHWVTEAETAKGVASETVSFGNATLRTLKNLFVYTRVLRKYLPDIYWTTVFGKPYVDLFSRDRILSCPAHRVRELDNGSILLQLTPELTDTATEEAAFERIRQLARNHLGADAFFDPAKGADYQYQVPQFAWRPVLH